MPLEPEPLDRRALLLAAARGAAAAAVVGSSAALLARRAGPGLAPCGAVAECARCALLSGCNVRDVKRP